MMITNKITFTFLRGNIENNAKKTTNNSHMDAKIDFSSENIIAQFQRHVTEHCGAICKACFSGG